MLFLSFYNNINVRNRCYRINQTLSFEMKTSFHFILKQIQFHFNIIMLMLILHILYAIFKSKFF